MSKVRTVTAKPTWTPDLLARTFVGYRQSSPGARIICSALGNETPRHEGPACNHLHSKHPNSPIQSSSILWSCITAGYPGVGNSPIHPRSRYPTQCPVLSTGCPHGWEPPGTWLLCQLAQNQLQMGWCGVKLIRSLVFSSTVSNPIVICNKWKHWVSPKSPNNSWFLIVCPLIHAFLLCLPSLVLHLEQKLQVAPSAAQQGLSHKEGSESSSWESILAIHHCLFSGKPIQLCNILLKHFGLQFKIFNFFKIFNLKSCRFYGQSEGYKFVHRHEDLGSSVWKGLKGTRSLMHTLGKLWPGCTRAWETWRSPCQKLGHDIYVSRAWLCSPSAVSVFCEHRAWLWSLVSAFPQASIEPGDFA